MRKEITRVGKIIVVDIRNMVTFANDMSYDFLIDSKSFNWIGSFFGIDPTQKTYDKANKWADDIISLHAKNS